jgi:hypothetical protein
VQTQRMSGVTRVADWEYAGVAYYVHLGSDARTTGHLTILAVGPAGGYRSVVIGPDGADQALRIVLAAPDAATRAGTAECLLAMRGLFLS